MTLIVIMGSSQNHHNIDMNELVELLKNDTNAANAFGALASAAVALFALILSVISVVISVWASCVQRKHNKLSVRPLAEVTVADYENSLRVKLRNNGSGPMIVADIIVSDGSETCPSLIEWMPKLYKNRHWNTFSNVLKNRSLLPTGEIILLELTEYEAETGFAKSRDLVRDALAPLKVTVKYTDIYNTKLPPYEKSLSWFGRHKS